MAKKIDNKKEKMKVNPNALKARKLAVEQTIPKKDPPAKMKMNNVAKIKSSSLTIKRVKTGIRGFDNLVQGGFPEGFTVMVSGTAGTGKTLLCLEYLHHGASQFKEKSMLVTLEQRLGDVRRQAKNIGLDIVSLEKSGMLTLIHMPIKSVNVNTVDALKNEIKKRGIKRLVFDSLSTLAINAPVYSPIKDIALRDIMNYKAFFSPPILGDFVVKRFLYTFLDDLKDLGCTTLVTAEAPESGESLSRDTVSEFICDGVLSLRFEALGGDFSRSLLIRKMRGTDNDEDMHPLEITDNGLRVHSIK